MIGGLKILVVMIAVFGLLSIAGWIICKVFKDKANG